jgi:hypothetical protein
MANLKRTYNLPPQHVEYINRLATGNATSDTEVIKAGIEVLSQLGRVGVRSDFVAKGPSEQEAIFLIKGGIDLGRLAEVPTEAEAPTSAVDLKKSE